MRTDTQLTAPPLAGARSLPRHWRRLAFWVAIGVVFGAIAGFGAAHSDIWAAASTVIFLTVAGLLAGASLRRYQLPWPRLAWPMAAFGVLVCLQWVLRLTLSRSDTLTNLIQLTAAGGMFYLAYLGLLGGHRRRLAGTMLWAAGGALAAEAILQAFTSNQRIYWFRDASYASPMGPFYYHNHFAGCMDLLIPVGIAYAFGAQTRGEIRWVGWLRRGILPALAVIAVILSNSRGGFATLVVEAALFAALAWKRLRAGLLPVALIAILAVAGLAGLSNWRPLVRHWQLLSAQDSSAVARWDALEACWRIFRDHPWLGAGFGSFGAAYPQYQRIDQGVQLVHAHDEFAQALAETGLAGLAAICGFLAVYLPFGWKLRQSRWDAPRSVQFGAFIGTVGFLFHSLIDFQFHNPANLWLFFFCVALVSTPARPTRSATGVLTATAAPAPQEL